MPSRRLLPCAGLVVVTKHLKLKKLLASGCIQCQLSKNTPESIEIIESISLLHLNWGLTTSIFAN